MTVKQEFESGKIGWEVLFIFIAGALGDMVVHLLNFKSLNYYYKQFGWLLGAFWGGIACVIALLIAKLFMFIKESI